MAQHTGVLGATSLLVFDTPIGYAPPRGPRVSFTVAYNQRDQRYPLSPGFTNLGSRWSLNWLNYVLETRASGASVPSQVVLHAGTKMMPYYYVNFDSTTLTSATQFYRHDVMTLRADGGYEILHGDGTKEIYTLNDGSANPRRLFLTSYQDAAGNAVTLSYDPQYRIVTVTDALGQASTLSYGNASFPNQVTQIADPFGRTAQFSYNTSGFLMQITDLIGLKSSFTYGDGVTPDFMTSLSTPYGTHTFANGASATDATNLWLEATDPMGSKERWEFRNLAPGIPYDDPQAPTGAWNFDNWYRTAFYWNKRTLALHPGDYTKAQIVQFLHNQTATSSNVTSAVLESRKDPLDNREWYFYPGQADYRGNHWIGTDSLPNRVARLAPDGTEQNRYFTYNRFGKPALVTDPVGRITKNIYSPDGIDLLEVHNITAGTDDLLAKYTYNPQHKPLTATDASGQTTSYTYNGFGQVLTITNPRNETTTFTYDPSGYLQTITGAATGSTTTFGYDTKGRVQTVTAPDGSSTTTAYDDLDRATLVTHADGSSEQMVYDRLDLWKSKDRLNRWTEMTYNPLRQLVEVQDPLGRITKFDWCGCGSQLEGLTDAMGRKTTWIRDLEGRVVSKGLADSSATSYAYDVLGRLQQRTDALGQRTQYSYAIDNNLLQVSYPNALRPTPTASYTYDSRYNRLATSTGAFGTTTYTYNPITATPTLGAGRLAAVTGPWANSAITYGYDSLGRVTTRGINGVSETRAFDALGRLGPVTNSLGTFGYVYDGVNARLKEVDYPNGQKTIFSYFDVTQEYRLQGISNQRADTSGISSFGYTYFTDGQIHTWSQGADAQLPKVYTFTYDAANQLTSAVLNGPNGALIRQFGYGYDLLGNRTTESVDGSTTTSTFNATNQMTGQQHALNSVAIARRREDEARRRAAASPQTATPR